MKVLLEVHPSSSEVYHILKRHITTVKADKINKSDYKEMVLKFSIASSALIRDLVYSLALVRSS